MKIIDLLNKITNGESVPLKIKYDKVIWDYDKDSNDYYSDEWLFGDYLGRTTLNEFINDEIKIIEEYKPIEKLSGSCDITTSQTCRFNNIEVKINEIIDKLNKLKEGK